MSTEVCALKRPEVSVEVLELERSVNLSSRPAGSWFVSLYVAAQSN